MRRCWMMVVLGIALAVGCGGSRSEVRLVTPAGQPTMEDRIDGAAAGYLNNLLGGLR